MGVRGLVRNEKDGSLFIEAEADDITLEVFLEWCHEGSDRSKVEQVIVTPGDLKGYQNFEIVKK
jgi:acylphosphatase